MRFVAIKSENQQAALMLHRTRDLLVRQRSSLISSNRAHFAEFGIVVGQGIRNVERLLALLGAEGDNRLPALAAEMLGVTGRRLKYPGKADMLCPTKIGRFAPKAVSPTDFALSNSSTRPARAKSYFWADLIERSA